MWRIAQSRTADVESAAMDFVMVYWLLVVSSAISALRLWFSRSRAAISMAIVSSFAALAWAGYWSWLLRDGLGPDAVESTGWQAWRRFGSEMWFPCSVSGATVGVAVACYLLRKQRQEAVPPGCGR
jgi:hypothetical protein